MLDVTLSNLWQETSHVGACVQALKAVQQTVKDFNHVKNKEC